MNKKGQALVEFIIIIPIVIIFLMGITDFVMIFSCKQNLENNLTEVVKIYEKKQNDTEIKEYLNLSDIKIDYDITKKNKYTKITLTNYYKFITPGLDKILPSPYEINVERVILSE